MSVSHVQIKVETVNSATLRFGAPFSELLLARACLSLGLPAYPDPVCTTVKSWVFAGPHVVDSLTHIDVLAGL